MKDFKSTNNYLFEIKEILQNSIDLNKATTIKEHLSALEEIASKIIEFDEMKIFLYDELKNGFFEIGEQNHNTEPLFKHSDELCQDLLQLKTMITVENKFCPKYWPPIEKLFDTNVYSYYALPILNTDNHLRGVCLYVNTYRTGEGISRNNEFKLQFVVTSLLTSLKNAAQWELNKNYMASLRQLQTVSCW